MKKNRLKKMKKNNPNLFKERWTDKQTRLAYEKERKLDNAVVRRSAINMAKGPIIN